MSKHQINITEAAEQDLAEIIDYIAKDNPASALKLAEKIEQSILQLEDFLLIGAIPKNKRLIRQGYRILIVDIYLVFYVLLNDKTIEIRRIISGKRDYKFYALNSPSLVCTKDSTYEFSLSVTASIFSL